LKPIDSRRDHPGVLQQPARRQRNPRTPPNVYDGSPGRDLDREVGSGYMRVNHPILTELPVFGPLSNAFSE